MTAVKTPGQTPGQSNRKFTLEDATPALRQIINEYGREMAENVEKVYRWETAHFKSSQFTNTGSAGMEAALHSKAPNYGWNPASWINDINSAPIG